MPETASIKELSFPYTYWAGVSIFTKLGKWKSTSQSIYADDRVGSLSNNSASLQEVVPLARNLTEICDIGHEAAEYILDGKIPQAGWKETTLSRLDKLSEPKAALEFAIIQPIKELVVAAAEQEKRKTMSPEEWEKMIKEMAAPKKR